MIRFLADEDLNGRIVRGLLLRSHDLDLVRVQDVGTTGLIPPTAENGHQWPSHANVPLRKNVGRDKFLRIRKRTSEPFH